MTQRYLYFYLLCQVKGVQKESSVTRALPSCSAAPPQCLASTSQCRLGDGPAARSTLIHLSPWKEETGERKPFSFTEISTSCTRASHAQIESHGQTQLWL